MQNGDGDRKQTVSAEVARDTLGELLDRVLAGKRIVITRHGKPHGSLVSIADLEKLEALEAA